MKEQNDLGDALWARALRWFASLRPKTDPPTAATPIPIAPPHSPDEFARMTDKQIEGAALVVLEHLSRSNFSLGEAEAHLRDIQEYRPRLKKIANRRIRRAYEEWLDHFEDDARDDIEEHQPEALQEEEDEWERDLEEMEEDEARAKLLPRP